MNSLLVSWKEHGINANVAVLDEVDLALQDSSTPLNQIYKDSV